MGKRLISRKIRGGVALAAVIVAFTASYASAATCHNYDGSGRACDAWDAYECNGSRSECIGLGFYYVPTISFQPLKTPTLIRVHNGLTVGQKVLARLLPSPNSKTTPRRRSSSSR